MGCVVDREIARAFDLGIFLRRRERRMAEQLLHRAQVPAVAQHMRGKRMPERMRRRARATARGM